MTPRMSMNVLVVMLALALFVGATLSTALLKAAPIDVTPEPGSGAVVLQDMQEVLFSPPGVRALTSGAAVAPMTETFEGVWPSDGWELLDMSAVDGGEFLWGKRDCHPHEGSYAGWSVGGGATGSTLSCSGFYPNNARVWAVYGPFDLRSARSARLIFHFWGRTEYSASCSFDFFYVGSSLDGENFTGRRYCGDWSNGSDGNRYHRHIFDLTSRLGQPQVWVAFVLASDSTITYEGITIDDITLDVDTSVPTNTPTPVSVAMLPLVVKQPTMTPTRTPTPTPAPTATPDMSDWLIIAAEDFEGSFPGSNWVVSDNAAGYGEYYWAKRDCRPSDGSNSGWALGGGADGNNLTCGANYPNRAFSWLRYGPFSLVGANDAELRFRIWVNSELNYDLLFWGASINGIDFYGSGFTGNSNGWQSRTLDLKNVYRLGDLRGRSDVWIAFVFSSDYSVTRPEGAYVDGIVLRKKMSGQANQLAGIALDCTEPKEELATDAVIQHCMTLKLDGAP